jgi:hypothetical protein
MTNKELLDLIKEMEAVLQDAYMHIPISKGNAGILKSILDVTVKAQEVLKEAKRNE